MVTICILIRRARSIRRGRRYVVSLGILISVVVLLQRSDGRRRSNVRRGSLIVRVIVVIISAVIIAVVAVLSRSWRRCSGRRVATTVVRLLPADLPDTADFLLSVLIHVFLVRLLSLVFVFLVVPII